MSKFDADKISLNKDDIGFIRNEVEIIISPITNDMNDLKGNVSDIIIKAVAKGFKQHENENCEKHKQEIKKVDKKHTIWSSILSVAIFIISVLLIIVLTTCV